MRNYISNREIDDLGESIVKSFFGKTNTDNSFMYVDIESIAWMMGLNIVYEEFSEDDTDKLGFLSNGLLPLKVKRNNQIESVIFPQGTIVIDTKVRDEECVGRLRFTIAHEVAHHVLNSHNSSAEFCREFNSERDYSYTDFENQLNMAEIQANRLASAMLMPKFVIDNAMNVMNAGEPVVVYGEYI